MIPAFDPGPNPFGRPPVYVGGFGPRMVEVAGEVADGLITHPFTTRQSLEMLTLPALERGLARVRACTRADVHGGVRDARRDRGARARNWSG